MNYGTIKYFDIANGEGIRTSLFVSGCRHHCKDCFNAVAWDFNYGEPFTKDVEDKIIESLRLPYVQGLSLLGGEPFEAENQRGLLPFLKRVKAEVPGKTIWSWTGFTFEDDLLNESRARCEVTDEMLSLLDVLVDGKFDYKLKDISLQFRGSSNQRIIDMKKSLAEGKTVLKDLK